MRFVLQPWQLFFLILAGWVNRQQQEIIEFQSAQIRILMQKMGRKRILLADEQRRFLAVKGKALGRKTLMELTTIVTPDTIMRWHRRLIAAKWDYSNRTFLKAHWESIASVDFTTVEVWTTNGLTTFYILVVMRLENRRIEIAGVTENPNGDWVRQMARNLTGWGGFLANASYLLVDRDTKFQPFRTYVTDFTNTKIVLLPPKSPNLNAHIERFMRSMKSECLNRMIFFGRQSLERALREFVTHYHGERNHQGLENRIIDPGVIVGLEGGELQCRERLGGLLHYYYREAA